MVQARAIGRFRSRIDRSNIEVPTLLLSATLVVLTVCGVSFDDSNSIRSLLPTWSAVIGVGLVVAGSTALAYVVFRWLFRWIDGVRDASSVTVGRPPTRSQVKSTFLTVFIPWLIWIVVQFPGHIPYDTFEQLLQWEGVLTRTNHHPWFDSMVFGWFFSFGALVGYRPLGLFIYLIVQAAALAAGVTLIISYLTRHGLEPRLRRALVLSAALLPPFVTLAGVMTKDSFSAIFIIPSVLLFVELGRTRGRFSTNRTAALIGTAAALGLILSKRSNIYIVIICAIIVLVRCQPAYRRRIGAGTLAILVLATAWSRIVLPVWGIAEPTSRDMFSIPTQQTARTVAYHGDELPENERKAIDRVLGIDGLAEAYVPRKSDKVKKRLDLGAPRSAQLAYLRTWFVEGLRYPGTYLSATFNNTFELFAPVRPLEYETSQATLQSFDDRFRGAAEATGSDPDTATAMMFEIDSPSWLDGIRSGASFSITAINGLTPITSKAFFASWVPFIACAYAWRRRDRFLGLVLVPSFLELAVLVAGPVTYARYITPMMYLAILTIGAMVIPRPLPGADRS